MRIMFCIIIPDFFYSRMAEVHHITVLGENAADVLADIIGISVNHMFRVKLLSKAEGGQCFIIKSAGINQAVEAAADGSGQLVGG